MMTFITNLVNRFMDKLAITMADHILTNPKRYEKLLETSADKVLEEIDTSEIERDAIEKIADGVRIDREDVVVEIAEQWSKDNPSEDDIISEIAARWMDKQDSEAIYREMAMLIYNNILLGERTEQEMLTMIAMEIGKAAVLKSLHPEQPCQQ